MLRDTYHITQNTVFMLQLPYTSGDGVSVTVDVDEYDADKLVRYGTHEAVSMHGVLVIRPRVPARPMIYTHGGQPI